MPKPPKSAAILVVVCATFLAQAENRDYGVIKNQKSPQAKLKSVDLNDVRWTDGFWAERFAQTRDVTLPKLWELASDSEMGHAIQNLRIAAGLEKGEFAGTHWQDAWVYNYLYSVDKKGLWVHHYGANVFDGELNDGRGMRFTQETDYPWDGKVRITVDAIEAGRAFSIRLRIPGWVQNAKLTINGRAAKVDGKPASYATVERNWVAGDVVELELPMPVRMIVADPRIEQTRNQVAVMRGPVVYCLESVDLPKGVVFEDISLPAGAKWKFQHKPDLLGGVTVLTTKALAVEREARQDIGGYRHVSDVQGRYVDICLIPYYAWNNREEPKMTVWLPVRW